MSVINKFLDVMRLNSDEDDFDFDNEDYALDNEFEDEIEPKFPQIKLSWLDKEAKQKESKNKKSEIKESKNKELVNKDSKKADSKKTDSEDTISKKSAADNVGLTNSFMSSKIDDKKLNSVKTESNNIDSLKASVNEVKVNNDYLNNTKTYTNDLSNKNNTNTYTKEDQAQKPKATEMYKSSKSDKPKITSITKSTRKQANGMEVCVIKPTSMEDEIEITDTLLNGRTVIINMEGIDVELAQRIIDFTSGSTYAIHGNLQKISNYIFLATPNGIDISGDIQNLMESFSLAGLTV